MVSLAGSLEAADDVVKLHTSALDTFQSPNWGSLGRVGSRASPSCGGAAGGGMSATRAAERVHLVTVTLGMDGSLIDAAAGAGADAIVVAATGPATPRPRSSRRRSVRWPPASRWSSRPVAGRPRNDRLRVPWRRRNVGTCRSDPRGDVVRSEGSRRGRAGPRGGTGSRGPRGAAGRPATPSRCHSTRSSPGGSRPSPTARATASGGWRRSGSGRTRRVRRLGGVPRDAGRPAHRAHRLEPDQVAIPGLTDAHLHLAEAGIAARHVDLHGAISLEGTGWRASALPMGV